jgi:hypothetical protein
MKQVYKAFKFGTYLSNVHDILNVTLDNDMYNENIRGSREIIEDKVQGVEAPYFFYVDDEPLEFEVTFAFENKTKTNIQSLIRTLLAPETYRALEFGEFSNSTFVEKSPKYNVIFNGEPVISFVGKTSGNSYVYDGYFTLNARCDRPYGYKNVASFTVTPHAGMNHESPADITVYPNISITVSTSTLTNIVLKSWQNSNWTGSVLSQIGFTSIAAGETLTISGNLFTITSNIAQSTIYSRWDRNNFKIFSGNNYLTVEKTGAGTLTVQITYDAPTFINVV